MVSSPSTKNPRPSARTASERKAMFGKFSTSRKSAERTWLSRFGSLVLIEDASIVTVTDERAGSWSVTIVPLNRSKRPRTLLTTRWRTTKETSEWAGSMSHVPATRPGIWTAVLSVICIASFVCLIVRWLVGVTDPGGLIGEATILEGMAADEPLSANEEAVWRALMRIVQVLPR